MLVSKCRHRWTEEIPIFPGDFLSSCAKCGCFKQRLVYPNHNTVLYYTYDQYLNMDKPYHKRLEKIERRLDNIERQLDAGAQI